MVHESWTMVLFRCHKQYLLLKSDDFELIVMITSWSFFLVQSCFQIDIFPTYVSEFTIALTNSTGIVEYTQYLWKWWNRRSWSFIHKLLRLNGLWIQSALIELVSARLSPIRFTILTINCRLRTIFKLTTLSHKKKEKIISHYFKFFTILPIKTT